MTKTLILMQGIAGSGKSTIAKLIANGTNPFDTDVTVRSTDEFWGNTPEEYDFKPEMLGTAHNWNQFRVESDMADGVMTIIVDNTNITRRDTKPYFDFAKKFGYDVQVVRVTVPISLALARNAQRPVGRRVPEDIIRSQYARMEDLHV